MFGVKLVELKAFGDERGSLIALEKNHNVPFDIKRVYYIYNTKRNVPRGAHAHRKLEQLLVCVTGSCKIKLDDGKTIETVELNSPELALYVGKNIWGEMFDFSQGCVLMVMASEYYNSDEYIYDYNEFINSIDSSI